MVPADKVPSFSPRPRRAFLARSPSSLSLSLASLCFFAFRSSSLSSPPVGQCHGSSFSLSLCARLGAVTLLFIRNGSRSEAGHLLCRRCCYRRHAAEEVLRKLGDGRRITISRRPSQNAPRRTHGRLLSCTAHSSGTNSLFCPLLCHIHFLLILATTSFLFPFIVYFTYTSRSTVGRRNRRHASSGGAAAAPKYK